MITSTPQPSVSCAKKSADLTLEKLSPSHMSRGWTELKANRHLAQAPVQFLDSAFFAEL
jgi:hypothetical protein